MHFKDSLQSCAIKRFFQETLFHKFFLNQHQDWFLFTTLPSRWTLFICNCPVYLVSLFFFILYKETCKWLNLYFSRQTVYSAIGFPSKRDVRDKNDIFYAWINPLECMTTVTEKWPFCGINQWLHGRVNNQTQPCQKCTRIIF